MSKGERLMLVSFATCAIRGLRMQDIMAPIPGMTEAVLRELKAHFRASLTRGSPEQRAGLNKNESVPEKPDMTLLRGGAEV